MDNLIKVNVIECFALINLVYFQVFMTVVIFGLFHGLVYLPVILSWVGPTPYETADPAHCVTESTAGQKPVDQTTSLLDSVENKENLTVEMNGFMKVRQYTCIVRFQ